MKKVIILIIVFLISMFAFSDERTITKDQIIKLTNSFKDYAENKNVNAIYDLLFKDNLFKIVGYEFSFNTLNDYYYIVGSISGMLEHAKKEYAFIFENEEINDLYKFFNDFSSYYDTKDKDAGLAMKMKMLLSERAGKLKAKYPDSEFIGNLFLILD